MKFLFIVQGEERGHLTQALTFVRMDDDESQGISVVPPLLRKEVLNLRPTAGDYVLGYMVNSGFASQENEWHDCGI